MDYCEKCMRPLAEGQACPACGALSAAPVHHLRPGTLLRGRYLIGRVFEEAERTLTYIARDTEQDEILAVQEYFPAARALRDHTVSNGIRGMEHEQQSLSRLAEKARILRRFNTEPGVVRVTDVLEENGTVYTVMERPTGITLQTYLVRKGRIGAQPLLAGMAPMMRTLQRLHENGLIHRRISPETVRLYTDGTVRLIGFGVAGESLQKGGLKHGYAPAEQYELRDRSDPRSDIYSLCATIYVAVTGNLLPAAADRSRAGALIEPSRYGAELTREQEAALLQGLEPDADRRPGSVRALMLALGLEAELPAQEPEQEEPVQETVPEMIPEPAAPAEEAAVEEAPAEEAATEEAPAEELPAEEAEEAAEPAEDAADREARSNERKGFSWKELLALAKIGQAEEEENEAWDSFIETTREMTQEQEIPAEEAPAEETPAAEVPAEDLPVAEMPVTEPAAEPEPDPDLMPVFPESVSEPAPEEEQEEAPQEEAEEDPVQADRRSVGRRIAIGLMALVAVIGAVCAIWMAQAEAAEPEAYAIVEEI